MAAAGTGQRLLLAELARVRRMLEVRAGRPAGDGAPVRQRADRRRDGGDRLRRLVDTFRLSDFERDIVLVCAGMELDSRFPALCAAVHDSPLRDYPTFGLAMTALPDPHWDAFSPGAPLRYWRLLDVDDGPTLVTRPLRIDERALHYLTGVTCLDSRLDGLLRADTAPPVLAPSQAYLVDEVAGLLRRQAGPVVVVLDGPDVPGRRQVARGVARALDRVLLVAPAAHLPPPGAAGQPVARLLQREVALLGAVVLLDYDRIAGGDPGDTDLRSAAAFAEQLDCPLMMTGEPALPAHLSRVRRTVALPAAAEQRTLWSGALPGGIADQIEQAVERFRFGATDIEQVAAELGAAGAAGDGLLRACRERARTDLSDLAVRVEPRADWSRLVLPPAQRDLLHDVVRQVRHRRRVYEDWGFEARASSGLGITALFVGDSGTGKTLAAEILAADLALDLYRIDLSTVVSKYVGETEKNLKRVFDAAERSGAVLLFDEADALFGKRSEVRDSHDRYANLEIAYLLQRMEAYRGLAILTTNLKHTLDRSFLRRIRFLVTFPFPDEQHRKEIWRRTLPDALPVHDVDLDLLAQLQVSGGTIRNIAMGAAFLAADDDSAVRMHHLMHAARREYTKLERSLTDAETAGWI